MLYDHFEDALEKAGFFMVAERRPTTVRKLRNALSRADLTEQEVRMFIQDGYDWAAKIIKEKNVEFERLAQGLLEYETLTGDEIKRVIDGKPPTDPDGEDDKPDVGSAPSITAIPKAKGKKTPPPSGGLEPEPST